MLPTELGITFSSNTAFSCKIHADWEPKAGEGIWTGLSGIPTQNHRQSRTIDRGWLSQLKSKFQPPVFSFPLLKEYIPKHIPYLNIKWTQEDRKATCCQESFVIRAMSQHHLDLIITVLLPSRWKETTYNLKARTLNPLHISHLKENSHCKEMPNCKTEFGNTWFR